MSEIKSFTLNGTKYDSFVDLTARKAIEDLAENPLDGSCGMSSAAGALLIEILRSGSYVSDQSANIAALGRMITTGGEEPAPVIYSITYRLANLTSSNTASDVAANDDYVTALTADEGYTLGSVSVTMGGVDVTAAVYGGGKITIAAVTGHVVITAEAVEEETDDGSGKTVAMSQPTATNNYSLNWYSDGGSTPFAPAKNYMQIMASAEVFQADTTVRITLNGDGSTNVFDTFNVACSLLGSDGVPGNYDDAFYAQKIGSEQWSKKIAHEVEYTVRAGYYLIITAYNGFDAGCGFTMTVEVV